MYLLFRFHNIMPMKYHQMGYGERQIVRAFMHQEIDDRNKEIESIEKG
ncbi:MAG: hypothetical protein SOY46_02410 [Butyrivibrio crossotus]|nr:hypothetical protein [Butyrivibrio crossotus]